MVLVCIYTYMNNFVVFSQLTIEIIVASRNSFIKEVKEILYTFHIIYFDVILWEKSSSNILHSYNNSIRKQAAVLVSYIRTLYTKLLEHGAPISVLFCRRYLTISIKNCCR